jgi:hypothetical protein
MLNTALEGRGGAMQLFSERDPLAGCVFCGKARPLELVCTWMCSRCKRKPLFELFCLIHVPERSGRKGVGSPISP